MKIKKTDNIMVIAGKDRGKTGAVERVFAKDGKVLITGVAMAKKHLKPSRKNPRGGIINMPMPIAASNVMVVCPHCSKPVRVAYRVTESTKERICRKCQGNLDTKVQIKADKAPKASKVKEATAKVKEKNV